VLLFGIIVVAITGLVSYAAYDPRLPANDTTPEKGLLGFYLFDWPTHPPWLYRLSQGVHVILGLTLVPVLLAKLWSVIPKLFAWPPARSLAEALERASLLLLVGGAVFEFVTGILNIQLFYVFPFSFYPAHLYGAWIFLAAFVVHVAFKLPRMIGALRSRSIRRELRTGLRETRPEPPDPYGLVAVAPAPPSVSRRGLFGFVGGACLTLFGLSVGQYCWRCGSTAPTSPWTMVSRPGSWSRTPPACTTPSGSSGSVSGGKAHEGGDVLPGACHVPVGGLPLRCGSIASARVARLLRIGRLRGRPRRRRRDLGGVRGVVRGRRPHPRPPAIPPLRHR
jgi:hypothetical protein